MVISAQQHQMTVEEFEAFVLIPANAERLFEYIAGEVIEVVSRNKSSGVAAELVRLIGNHVALENTRLAHITGADGGYAFNEQRYIPDVGLISKAKFPELTDEPWIPHAPDLAVEVLSPSNTPAELAIKTSNYLAAGTIVWVVDPDKMQVAVHRPGQIVQVLKNDDKLEGDDILNGLSLTISEIF